MFNANTLSMGTTVTEAVRDYKFSDGLLEQLADFTAGNLTRDLAELAARGITTSTVAALQNLRTDFTNTPTDTELRALVTEAVENKDTAREAALVNARRLRTAAQNVYGLQAAKYRRFGFEDMDKLKENDLPRALRRMHRTGTALLAELASEGIDTVFLIDFAGSISNYDSALDAVDVAEENRDHETEVRIQKGNTLYKEIVRVCNIGKDVFVTTSEATYNDYVIENYTGTGSNSVTREGDLEGNEIKTINTTGLTIAATTNMHLFGRPGTVTRWYFSATEGTPANLSDPYVDVDPSTDAVYRASDLGFNGSRPYLLVQNLGGNAGSYKVIIAQ